MAKLGAMNRYELSFADYGFLVLSSDKSQDRTTL
jgi:hypothetical protein